ncbi:hypothetical protein AB0J52_34475, partial [Spirillospora sp. NPDC049652]
ARPGWWRPRCASDAAFDELATEIVRTSEAVAKPDPVAARRARRKPVLGIGAVAAAVAAGAVFLGWPGGEHPAEALSFTRDGQYVKVAVRDPKADPDRLRTEFAAHGLAVKLDVRPASPSLVGAMLSASTDGRGHVELEHLPGADCGGTRCRTGVRIPVGLRTPVTVVLGRAPRPGERILITGSATAPGEILAGVPVTGRTVKEVVAALRQRGGTVAAYMLDRSGGGHPGVWNLDARVVPAGKVKGGWYVSSAFSGATAGTVRLVVSEQRVHP